jgi:hypothetical protein
MAPSISSRSLKPPVDSLASTGWPSSQRTGSSGGDSATDPGILEGLELPPGSQTQSLSNTAENQQKVDLEVELGDGDPEFSDLEKRLPLRTTLPDLVRDLRQAGISEATAKELEKQGQQFVQDNPHVMPDGRLVGRSVNKDGIAAGVSIGVFMTVFIVSCCWTSVKSKLDQTRGRSVGARLVGFFRPGPISGAGRGAPGGDGGNGDSGVVSVGIELSGL